MKSLPTHAQIAAFRLARQHLRDQQATDLATVCRDVCGIQAQLMAAAEIALWARTPNLAREEIHAALWAKRTLVKTSCMRQTLHLIPTDEFAIYISALKQSRTTALERIMARYGMTRQDRERVNTALMDALATGPMTQPELREYLSPKFGEAVQEWMRYVWGIQVFRSALVEGLICYGPEATFVRVDQWLPKQRDISAATAQQLLLRRYLRSYGPATMQDFAGWSGVSIAEAKAAWVALAGEVQEIALEQGRAAILREDGPHLENGTPADPALCLLPHFDAYLLGHVKKDHLVDAARYKQVYRNQGWISPVVLQAGRIVGTWSYKRRGRRLSLTIEPFVKYSRQMRAQIEERAASLGAFLQMPYELEFGGET